MRTYQHIENESEFTMQGLIVTLGKNIENPPNKLMMSNAKQNNPIVIAAWVNKNIDQGMNSIVNHHRHIATCPILTSTSALAPSSAPCEGKSLRPTAMLASLVHATMISATTWHNVAMNRVDSITWCSVFILWFSTNSDQHFL